MVTLNLIQKHVIILLSIMFTCTDWWNKHTWIKVNVVCVGRIMLFVSVKERNEMLSIDVEFVTSKIQRNLFSRDFETSLF